LSGFAITQLRQATETVLYGPLEAQTNMYEQIVGLLYDQFMTGLFSGLRLSGVDSARNYFNATITPDMLMGTCDYSIKMVSQLPQDDQSKWGQAEIAQRTQLMSDGDILDNVLEIEDSKQTLDKVKLQKAERGLPEATLYDLGQAAADRGDQVLAQMYLMAFDRLMMQQYGLMPPPGGTQPRGKVGPPGANGAKPPGQQPTVMPNAMTGAAPQPETSNTGPAMVAPNTPRPGAQGQPQ
jgi:hypothetical protein